MFIIRVHMLGRVGYLEGVQAGAHVALGLRAQHANGTALRRQPLRRAHLPNNVLRRHDHTYDHTHLPPAEGATQNERTCVRRLYRRPSVTQM